MSRLDNQKNSQSALKQEQSTFREHQGSPPVVWWCSSFYFSVLWFCFVCLHSVSCVSNVANVSGLSIVLINSLVFSNFYMKYYKSKVISVYTLYSQAKNKYICVFRASPLNKIGQLGREFFFPKYFYIKLMRKKSKV